MQNLPEAQAILSGMTVKELREIARDIHKASNDVKIPGYTKMVKAELVRMLSFEDAWTFAEMRINRMNDEADEREMNEIRAEIAAEPVGVEAVADMIAERTANYPTGPNEVAILRDTPGRAIVTAAFAGTTVGGSIVRKGKRLVLRAGDVTVTGTTFEKVAKLFAQRLGFRADVIDVARAF